MKKRNLIILIIICSSAIIFVLGRISGIFLLFTIKTASNYPNLKPHDSILTSNLLTPQNGDIIYYQQPIRTEFDNSYDTNRMMANEGDVLEVKKGVCYVNGKSIDENLDLVYPYLTLVKNQSFFNQNYPLLNDFPSNSDSLAVIYISFSEAKKLPNDIKIERITYKVGEKELLQPQLFGDKNNEFNIDNFGPIKIPKDSCFVIGDNRHQSDDSRFWGFVAKDNIKGVFVTKIGGLSWLNNIF